MNYTFILWKRRDVANVLERSQPVFKNLELLAATRSLFRRLLALGCQSSHSRVVNVDDVGWREQVGKGLHAARFDCEDGEVVDNLLLCDLQTLVNLILAHQAGHYLLTRCDVGSTSYEGNLKRFTA